MKPKPRSKSPQHRKPTIEALRALQVFAETDSISEAARRLGISQPVVTKKLEIFKDPKACGKLLLQLEGKPALTESGRSIIPAIEDLVRRYDRLFSFLQGEQTAPQVIRIGAGAFAAEHLLPQVLRALRKTKEACQVETRVCRGRERIVGTARGVFDFGIVTHDETQILQTLREERLSDRLLTVTALGRHPFCLLAEKKSAAGRELERLPAESPVPVSSLTRWELIGPDSQAGIRQQLDRHFAAGLLYFVAEGGGWAAAKEYARAGIGTALVPLAVVTTEDQKDLVCRRLAPQFAVTDYLIQLRDDGNPLLPTIREAILAAAKTIAEKS